MEDIKDFELSVVDSQKAVLGGAFNEFIFSARLDNLMMSFCGLMVLLYLSFVIEYTQALIDAAKDEKAISEEKNVLSVLLFDNEEIGSQSAYGAAR